MVFESADVVAVATRARRREIPPPLSSYGFQKLAVEYFARAAWEQYKAALTPWCGRSTAWASARAGRWAMRRSCPETSSSR
jgi:dTDP-4-dehydrorhamnose reductase